MALTHNSKLADTEPGWGGVDKTKLPRNAHADEGTADKKSTWRYPHHWVKGGSDLNDDGVFTKGEMYLHRGGLNAAWAAAQGARTGRQASAAIKAHLQRHRRALGLEKSDAMATELDVLFADPTERTYSKVATYRKTLAPEKTFIECKAASPLAKHGTIDGYASVWNVVDHQGESVKKGAFTKTIQERGSKIPLMVVHFSKGGDLMEAVGGTVELTEDDYGLKFSALWLGDARSQAVREKVMALRKQDLKIGASIGYRVIDYGFVKDERDGRTHTELRELALGELTVTLKPANEGAVITGAKTDEERQSLLTPFAPIADSKDLDDEGREQLVEELGGAEAVESLGNALKGIAEQTLGLLASKSQDTKPKDGDKKSANTPPKNGANADGSSSTKGKANSHLNLQALEKVRMEARKVSLK
jgi:HK97 family phage prohead protease